MAPHGEVWVFAEIEDGRIAEVSLELLGKGRELADALGVRLGAMLLGKDVRPLAGALHARGADVVYLADHGALAMYRTLPYARWITELVAARKPEIVL